MNDFIRLAKGELNDPIGEQFDLIDQAYEILLDTGVNIQLWVFEEIRLSTEG